MSALKVRVSSDLGGEALSMCLDLSIVLRSKQARYLSPVFAVLLDQIEELIVFPTGPILLGWFFKDREKMSTSYGRFRTELPRQLEAVVPGLVRISSRH